MKYSRKLYLKTEFDNISIIASHIYKIQIQSPINASRYNHKTNDSNCNILVEAP